ncbi:MAG: NAD-dependent epimerase/dehydratase family protein [Kiloniellales bacterium]|nr:NAD-dependent epimerase/dehydratase family protein [Kiloniellales bacterium]
MTEENRKAAVLVTGAGGFVGHHVCRFLARRGYAVRGALRARPPYAEEGVDYVAIGDIDDHTDWGSALDGVDIVVHAAGTTEDFTEPSGRWLVAHNQINVAGTASLAQAAVDRGVKRLIFLSSVGVRAAERDEDPTGFETSKYEAEQILRKTVATAPIELVVLRLPPLYGPEKQGALRAMAEAILRDRPLPLASVQNQMSLLFVGNLVSAIEACLENPAAGDHTFSISDGEAVSTPELVERLAEAMQRELDLWPCPTSLLGLLAGFAGCGKIVRALTRDVVFDDQEIVRDLGWQPPIEVDTALLATVRSWDLEAAAQQAPARRPGLRGRLTDAVFDLGERIVRMLRSRRDSRDTREAHST